MIIDDKTSNKEIVIIAGNNVDTLLNRLVNASVSSPNFTGISLNSGDNKQAPKVINKIKIQNISISNIKNVVKKYDRIDKIENTRPNIPILERIDASL